MSSLVFLLFHLLSSYGSLLSPRTSFLINSVEQQLVCFSLAGVHNTTTLLLNDDGSTLFVGAQDAILSLDVSQRDVIRLKKKVEWKPPKKETADCHMKVKNPMVDCINFIHILQLINSTHLYACGSHAHNPHDAYIDTETFTLVKHGSAKGRCPFSPAQRNTALTVDGELFTATTSDFRGVTPQISRHFSKDGRPDITQDLSIKLLEDPVFVKSVLDPSDGKLYFFFTEVGSEFSFLEELRIPRVAQVCKDDIGGQRILQRKWTSFAKAALICQPPKHLPLTDLYDVFMLRLAEGATAGDTRIYGVFSSQWSLVPESAVCVFRLQDLRTVFSQNYRTFNMETHKWGPALDKNSYLGQCGLHGASDAELEEVRRSFLTRDGLRPVGNQPLLVSSGQQYRRVVAMMTRAINGKHYTVLFLLTESGFLHKVVLLDRGPWVIEEIQVFKQPQIITTVLISPSKGVVYVGTSEGVAAVPVVRCSAYRTCTQCILARDPLCGWSFSRRVCCHQDDGPESLAQDLEDADAGKECLVQSSLVQDTEVQVYLNEVVRLNCFKPSNMAVLSWTSPQFHLQQNLFIQSDDGTLSFIATADTARKYQCQSEEGQHKEVVSIYKVVLNHKHLEPDIEDESYEDRTKMPLTTMTPPSGDTDGYEAENIDLIHLKGEDDPEDGSGSRSTTLDNGLVFGNCSWKLLDGSQPTSGEKNYHSEMVVVSVLMAACVCILTVGGLRLWRRRRAEQEINPLRSPEDGGRTIQSTESTPSLSSAEDPAMEAEL